jgi:divalent metal cation (Fe/Co/Zn/Cd) transporter
LLAIWGEDCLREKSDTEALWKTARLLAIITVAYNIAEGVISVGFGYSDETLSLFGFGLDSFVEVISGIGLWQMVTKTMHSSLSNDSFEKRALKITGAAFYLLASGLVLTAVYNFFAHNEPSTTQWGIIISLISLLAMAFLLKAKLHVGQKLGSQAIIADAHCTRTCIYLSCVLLASSLLFELLHIGFVDTLGALGIAWYAFKEGKEAFEKAKGNPCCCGDHCAK